jgi:2-dehydropantoate 2-reductase
MMRVAVLGAGAIGLLYGGWLQTAGADVEFIVRGARLETMRNSALIAAGRKPFRLDRIKAVASPDEAAPADVVLVAVKLYDLKAAVGSASAALRPGGIVVAVQNGIDVYRTVRAFLRAEQIAVGPVYAATMMTGSSSVSYGGDERVALGNPECEVRPLVHELVATWRRAGIEAAVSADINTVIWTKFLGLATNAALTCLARLPAGVLYHRPESLEIAKRSIAEIMAVGRAERIIFPQDAAESALGILQGFPPETVASMRHDLDAGRRLELEAFSGEISRLGRRHGLPTPVHDIAYALLKPFRDGAML